MLSRDQILERMRERVHHPAATRELFQLLDVDRDERATFRRHLKSLVADGELVQIRGNRFGLPEKMDLHVGRLQTHPSGYGFVSPEREMERRGDIFIPAHQMAEAMNGDRVVVRIEKVKDDGRVEGRVIRVLERANSSLVGRYDQAAHGVGIVVPFDRRVLMDIVIPSGQAHGAEPGQMVVVELTGWPTGNRGAIGRVREVLGDIDAPGVDTEIIIRKFGIPDAHSEESIAESIRLHTEVVGEAPRGWYTGRCSVNTVDLTAETGQFDWISDTYDDDLPYWREVGPRDQLIIPYTLEANDMRFATAQGFHSGDQFYTYLKDTFDTLYAEGKTTPRMMSVGLHCRLIGRPGRIVSLERFMKYVRRKSKVWYARRIDIAQHWLAHHPHTR